MKLNLRAFALSSGILWGVGLFVITWWKIIFGGASGNPTFVGNIFLGFSISPLGSVLGLIWAFIAGMICGAVFAFLYNKLSS